MIDLTPLDVRNKRGDFKKLLRGYDPQEVDVFLELAAERLEELVRENLQYRERSETLERQVASQSGREQAVQEALVTAQELRADIRAQAQREADHVLKEAETEARRLLAEAQAEARQQLRDAERQLQQGQEVLEEMERRRNRFLKAFRQLLERELDVVDVEQERPPLEDRTVDLELGGGRFTLDDGGAVAEVLSQPIMPIEASEVAEVPADPARAESASTSGDHPSDPVPERVGPAEGRPVDEEASEVPSLDSPIDELASEYTSPPPSDDMAEAEVLAPPEVKGDPEALLFSFGGEDAAEGEDDDEEEPSY